MKRESQQVLVWDIPTRLCHWLLVIGIAYAWFSVDILENMQQHFYAGYSVLSLLLFRIIWGVIGSDYARFGQFIYPLKEVLGYGKSFLPGATAKHKKNYLGHNPLGSISALLLLALIGLQAITGLFNSDDYYSGPLNTVVSKNAADTLGVVHDICFDVLTGFIVLHILAIIFYQVVVKEQLLAAMITGKKDRKAEGDKAISGSKLWLALLVMAICVALVYGLVEWLDKPADTTDFDFYY